MAQMCARRGARGVALFWSLFALTSVTMLSTSVLMLVLNHSRLTQHFIGQTQAFWSAEYGAARGIAWLSQQNSLPTCAPFPCTVFPSVPFPRPAELNDQPVGSQGNVQGSFTVDLIQINPTRYQFKSSGRSQMTGATRAIERTARVTAPTTSVVNINLTTGSNDLTGTASGTGAGYTYYGWSQAGGAPNQVIATTPIPAPALYVQLSASLDAGSYSLDVEANYTPCALDASQCGGFGGIPPGPHQEGFTVYVRGVSQYVGDPEFGETTESFKWYDNMGNCPASKFVNCGEGNWGVPANPASPLYLKFNPVTGTSTTTTVAAEGADLDGPSNAPGPTDIRNAIVFVPRNYSDAFFEGGGSLHFKSLRLRKVNTTGGVSVQPVGWLD